MCMRKVIDRPNKMFVGLIHRLTREVKKESILISPLDFAYEHFGRFVAPGTRTGWLSRPGLLLKAAKSTAAGAPNKGMAGTSVFIGESGVKVFGPDYRNQGFPAFGQTGDARPFAMRQLLSPPSERWLMVIFTKASTPTDMLALNEVGDSITSYVDQNERRRANPDALKRIADVFHACGISPRVAAEALHLQRESINGILVGEGQAKRRERHLALLAEVPKLPGLLNRLLDTSMPPSYVSQFMEMNSL